MKILYILPFVPYPLNKGGNQAVFNMIEKARSVHEVSVLLYLDNHHDEANAEDLKEVWKDVSFFYFSTQKFLDSEFKGMSGKEKLLYRLHNYILQSMTRKIARAKKKSILHMKEDAPSDSSLATGLNLGGFVKSHATLYNAANTLSTDFLQFVYETSRKGFDLIQVEFYEFLDLVYVLPPDVKTIFIHHEIRFVRNENECALFDHRSFYDQYLLRRRKAEELAALNTFHYIVTLTEVDKQILERHLPQKTIFASPAVIATTGVKSVAFTPAHDLVFVGGCDHFPNVDGILWFCNEIMPILEKNNSHTCLHIVGKWDEASRQLVHQLCPQAQFAGFVENLNQFLNGKISIVPIRIGSGMRIKILDSVAAATPLVTTSKGCEGLPLQDGRDCIIADTPIAFAKGITALQENTTLQQQLALSATETMQQHMDSQTLLEKRMDIYTKIAQDTLLSGSV